MNEYRSPSAGGEEMDSLAEELERVTHDVIGTLVTGDMNVHNIDWLRHSNGTSSEGRRLHEIASEFGVQLSEIS